MTRNIPDPEKGASRRNITMPRYFLRLAGTDRGQQGVDYDDLGEARNAAIRFLGSHLSDHPGFADEGHWRVDVENDMGQSLVHVIVATVTKREPV